MPLSVPSPWLPTEHLTTVVVQVTLLLHTFPLPHHPARSLFLKTPTELFLTQTCRTSVDHQSRRARAQTRPAEVAGQTTMLSRKKRVKGLELSRGKDEHALRPTTRMKLVIIFNPPPRRANLEVVLARQRKMQLHLLKHRSRLHLHHQFQIMQQSCNLIRKRPPDSPKSTS